MTVTRIRTCIGSLGLRSELQSAQKARLNENVVDHGESSSSAARWLATHGFRPCPAVLAAARQALLMLSNTYHQLAAENDADRRIPPQL